MGVVVRETLAGMDRAELAEATDRGGVAGIVDRTVVRGEADRGTGKLTEAVVTAGGHVLTARHCSADATEGDPLWLRLPSPDDEFGTVDVPVRVVDEDAALDVAVLGVDLGRERGDDTSGVATVLARVPPVPVWLAGRADDAVRTEGYPRDGRAGGLAFTGKIVDPAARLGRHRAYALQLQLAELAAGVPHGPGGHSGGPVLSSEQGFVVGVVRAYPPDETRDYAVGGSLPASRIQDLAERFPAVREAFAHRARDVPGMAQITALLSGNPGSGPS